MAVVGVGLEVIKERVTVAHFGSVFPYTLSLRSARMARTWIVFP